MQDNATVSCAQHKPPNLQYISEGYPNFPSSPRRTGVATNARNSCPSHKPDELLNAGKCKTLLCISRALIDMVIQFFPLLQRINGFLDFFLGHAF